MATYGAPARSTPPPPASVSTATNTVKRVTFCQSLTDKRPPTIGSSGIKNTRFSADDACRDLLFEPDPQTIRAYKDRKSFVTSDNRRVRLTSGGGSTMTTPTATTTTAAVTTPTEKSALIGGDPSRAESPHSAANQSPSTTTTTEKNRGVATTDRYGIKSYLHQFYEGGAVVNPEKYDEIEGGWSGNGDYRYLIRPRSHANFRRTFWWKVAVWCGINFLVVGILVILVGNLLPRRPVVIGSPRDGLEMVDRSAVLHNNNLEVCKIVGIVLFCAGGTVVAVALLLPSFLLHYSDELWDGGGSGGYEPPFKVAGGRRGEGGWIEDENCPLRRATTVETKVPATQEITRVQPLFEVYDSPIVVVGGSQHPPVAEAQSIVPLISGE